MLSRRLMKMNGDRGNGNFGSVQPLKRCPACKHVQNSRPLKCSDCELFLRKSENIRVSTRERKFLPVRGSRKSQSNAILYLITRELTAKFPESSSLSKAKILTLNYYQILLLCFASSFGDFHRSWAEFFLKPFVFAIQF